MKAARKRFFLNSILPALLPACLITLGIAASFAPQGITSTTVKNRTITPNGDGKNDTVEITFLNPQVSDVTGKIFDSRGALVATMVACPDSGDCLMWDAKSAGHVVRSGVYIYAIEAEGKVFRGSLLVVR